MVRRSEVVDNLTFLRSLEAAKTPAKRKTVLKRARHTALCVLAKLIYYVVSGQASTLISSSTRETLKEARFKRKIKILKKALGSRAKLQQLQYSPEQLLNTLIKLVPLLPVLTSLLWKYDAGQFDARSSRRAEDEEENESRDGEQDESGGAL
jgi:hypothetical protein